MKKKFYSILTKYASVSFPLSSIEEFVDIPKGYELRNAYLSPSGSADPIITLDFRHKDDSFKEAVAVQEKKAAKKK